MSKWTHAICTPCWNTQNPDRPSTNGREEGPGERCCWCGHVTTSGIYLRADPNGLSCSGNHGDRDQ